MTAEQVVYLKPEQILADDNVRFGLKRGRLDSLKAAITEAGGILVPVEVEPLAAASKNGHSYRLTSGAYRVQSAMELNKEGAALQVPAFVRPLGDPSQRLKRQLSENMDRENMSPMDQAVAVKKLFDAGVPRKDIRQMFARPGQKGVTQPASNSWLNITMGLLNLPKAIQEKVHDGRIGWYAAYELGKVSPDKRQAVLDRAEGEFKAQIEREAKDEEKFLEAERKATEAQNKVQETAKEIEAAKLDAEAKQAAVHVAMKALKEVQNTPVGDDPKAATEALKAAQANHKGAIKAHMDAANHLAKLHTKRKSLEDVAQEQTAKLAQVRKATKKEGRGKGKAGVGVSEVKKAAKSTGASTGAVPLVMADVRAMLKESAASKSYPKVAAVMEVVKSCVEGVLTTKEMVDELAVLTGEKQPVKSKK